MIKVHLLMKKEDINELEMKNDKVAVVFDVLLATSTITAALQYGAKEVIPVLNEEEARKTASVLPHNEYVLVGEYEGKTIEGFLDPNPLGLKDKIKDKTVILSTTNGTVAIQKSKQAKKVYACSLLNGTAVAERVVESHNNETIILVCSGSSGQFCLEDLYGTGYFLHCLSKIAPLELTDSAKAAFMFYDSYKEESIATLLHSRVGVMLENYGFKEEVEFVAQTGVFSVVPILKGHAMIREMIENGCHKE